MVDSVSAKGGSDAPGKVRIQSGTTQGLQVEDAAKKQQSYNQNTGRRANPSRSKQPQVRKVNDFIVFMDEVLGEGQYGKVCKAQLAADLLQNVSGSKQQAVRSTVDPSKRIYACKIIDISDISQEDLACIHKEVRIHGMVRSAHSVRLHQTIKTGSNIYMMQEYANGYDLAVLLKTRSRIQQEAARIIIQQVVHGIKDVWALGIIHRDIKLANILLHFPDKPELEGLTKQQKRAFLYSVDLTKVNFQVKISDFGLSTILDGTNTNLSICGTPLYSSPQLLKKRGYSAKVDTWALGVMLYEMLVGVTPFHSYEMKDLIAKINDGRYKLSLNEPICIETCLFMVQCLQMNENDRIPVEELTEHPFIATQLEKNPLAELDIEAFNEDMTKANRHFSGFSQTEASAMTSRFEDTVIHETDVILTTKASDQVRILICQLVNTSNFTECTFDMGKSVYFNKYYDVTMQKQFTVAQGAHQSVDELAVQISQDMKDNHFEAEDLAVSKMTEKAKNPDQVLNADDVDEEFFAFPDKNKQHEESKDLEQDVNQALLSTQELIHQNVQRQQTKAYPKTQLISTEYANQAAASMDEETKADMESHNLQGGIKSSAKDDGGKEGKFKRFVNWMRNCSKGNEVVIDDDDGRKKRVLSAQRSGTLEAGTFEESKKQNEKARLAELRRNTEQELKAQSASTSTLSENK